MDQTKNLDCNQIKIFINLEIIGEEKLYIFFLKSKKKKSSIERSHLVQSQLLSPTFIIYQLQASALHGFIKKTYKINV